jgi:hypothetical protein
MPNKQRNGGKLKSLQKQISKAKQQHRNSRASKALGLSAQLLLGAPRRKRTDNSSGRRGISETVRSAPVSLQAHSTNFMSQRFSSAARHDDYPEGGLRIVGEMPNNADDSLGLMASTTAVTTGSFSSASNTATDLGIFLPVSPTAYINSARSFNGRNLFGNSSNCVASMAQYFRAYRFRRLWLRYEGEAPTATTGSLQISYDRDTNSGMNVALTSATPTQIAAASGVVSRFPWWTPRCDVKLIDDMKCSGGDRLWECTATAAAVATSVANADMELLFQGVVLAVTDTAQTTSVQNLGRFRWVFVLDLYGFNAYPADGSINWAERRKAAVPKTLSQSQDRGDVKRPFDQPDADLSDFVSLSPRSNRLKVVTAVEPELQRQFSSAPPSVQGARVSSKK